MNRLAALRERLNARPDSEHEQAILRVVLVGLITVYMWARVSAPSGPLSENDSILLAGLGGFLILAIGIFVAICIWCSTNIPRRVLGMLADTGAITVGLFLAGKAGFGLVGVYLFLIFGNGFRYGRRYLFLCQTLCLIGFVSVVMTARWWRYEPLIGWDLMIWMIVLPLYVSTLLKRIQEARAKAEQVLKECLERERRAGMLPHRSC
jgi:two-component system sensor histidine kinase RpfC